MNEFQLCVHCQISFHQDLNKYGLCPLCQDKVISYFNKYMFHDEVVTERNECTIKTLDFDVCYGKTIEIFPSNEQEYFDSKNEVTISAYDSDDVIDYILQWI